MKKFKIVYSRVSSAAQSLELQLAAAKRYIASTALNENDDTIIYLNDHDVSATKLKMEQRPQLMQLIKLIKEGKVATVIVYKRDRLARNFYEFVDIVKIFIEFNVEVIYTASNEPPFKNKLALEAFYGMFSQIEGQNISTRTADARKQYPSKVFGYKRIKDNDQVSFTVNEEKIDMIQSLFNDFKSVENEEQFLDFLLNRKKGLKDPEQIIRILTNPFYSGHYESKSGFQKLTHVEPIVDLDLFISCKSKVDKFKNIYLEKLLEINNSYILTPVCGICGKEMKHRKKNQLDAGYFVCSSNHNKLAISSEEFNELVTQTVLDYVESISINLATKSIPKKITTKRKELEQSLETKTLEYLDTSLLICTLDKQEKSTITKFLEKIQSIKKEHQAIEDSLFSLRQLSNEVAEVTKLLSKLHFNFQEQETRRLIELLIDKVSVHNTHLQIELFLSSFAKDLDAS